MYLMTTGIPTVGGYDNGLLGSWKLSALATDGTTGNLELWGNARDGTTGCWRLCGHERHGSYGYWGYTRQFWLFVVSYYYNSERLPDWTYLAQTLSPIRVSIVFGDLQFSRSSLPPAISFFLARTLFVVSNEMLQQVFCRLPGDVIGTEPVPSYTIHDTTYSVRRFYYRRLDR